MKNGYYFYKTNYGNSTWQICMIYNGYAHFFGQISQKLGNEYLTECVEFGDMIDMPDETKENDNGTNT